jgi:hypothetical protein
VAVVVVMLLLSACAGGSSEAEVIADPPAAAHTLSERALIGLDATPVPLAIAGKTIDDMESIGQGSYLANVIAACDSCHDSPGPTADHLGGGRPMAVEGSGRVVYARNLTPDQATGLALTLDQFIECLRTGRDWRNPARPLQVMPWPHFRWMTGQDLRALFAYLQAIPAVANDVPTDAAK